MFHGKSPKIKKNAYNPMKKIEQSTSRYCVQNPNMPEKILVAIRLRRKT